MPSRQVGSVVNFREELEAKYAAEYAAEIAALRAEVAGLRRLVERAAGIIPRDNRPKLSLVRGGDD